MRLILAICAAALFLGVANLPIGYYTFLRIITAIGAIVVIVLEKDEGLNFWNVTFGLIAIAFNPILPLHLNDKTAWVFIDLGAGALFVAKLIAVQFFQAES